MILLIYKLVSIEIQSWKAGQKPKVKSQKPKINIARKNAIYFLTVK